MTRRASIIAYCLIIALVLLGLQSWSIAVGRLEQHVISAIEQRTGLVVTARERAEIAFLPLPRISLSNPAFQQRDGLLSGTALRIRARVRLLPLLAGNLSFDRIDLIVPQIDIAVPGPGDGLGNWLSAPLSYLEKLQVQSRIVMTGGSIFMRAQGAIQTTLRNVNLVLEGREANDPLALSGSLNWRGVPTELSLLWPMAAANAKLSLKVSSELMDLQFDGTRSVLDEPVVNGKLSLSTQSLPDLLDWFGERPKLAGAIGSLDLTADAQIKPREASLSNTVAKIDGDRLEGAIKLGEAGPRLSLSGTLAGTDLDLGRLLGRMDLWHADTASERAAPLDFEAWTAHDVDLRISVDSARLRGARLNDVATYLLVKKGRFETGLLRSNAYGGSAKGRLLAQAALGGIDVKFQAGLDRINLARAAADLPEFARLSGTGNLQVTLDGLGQSPEQIIASLSGKATATLRQGELAGFAFADLMRRLERNPKLLLRDWRQGKTPFDSATLNLSFANGIAAATDTQMTGQTYRIGLSGIMSLPSRSLDMTALLSSTSGTLQLPFTLQGPLDNPAFELDAGALRAGEAAPTPTLLTR
jgi:AsmA protein